VAHRHARELRGARRSPAANRACRVEQRYQHAVIGKESEREVAVREAARERVAEAPEVPSVEFEGRSDGG
jgi:hypothetical protein